MGGVYLILNNIWRRIRSSREAQQPYYQDIPMRTFRR
jgi:hypothetical protein